MDHNKPFKEALLRAIFDAVPDGIIVSRCVRDPQGNVVDAIMLGANRRAAEITGRSNVELAGRSMRETFPAMKPSTWSRYVAAAETRQPDKFELAYDANGLPTWFQVSVVPFEDGFIVSLTEIRDLKEAARALSQREDQLAELNKTLTKQAVELRDALAAAEMACQQMNQEIRVRKLLEGELRRIADCDPLTGVHNRRSAENILTHRLKEGLVSIALLDLDHFKHINDRYGHAAGDDVLRLVVGICQQVVRKQVDVIGRMGGEEFLIIMPELEAAEAMTLAEQIRHCVAVADVSVSGTLLSLSTSIGIACAEPGESINSVYARADAALYRAKQNGRNRVVLAEPGAARATIAA